MNINIYIDALLFICANFLNFYYKVTKPIQFNPKQKPIRIATEAPKTGDELFISGFGKVGVSIN